MTNNYLLFRLGERLFGVRMHGAIEILPWRRARPVPLAHSYVEGIMEYRGTIYPVINLTLLLSLAKPGPIGFTPPPEATLKGKSIILLMEGEKPYGITVDTVVKMSRLEAPDGSTPDLKGINTRYLKGVQYDEDQEIIILSFERLFHAG